MSDHDEEPATEQNAEQPEIPTQRTPESPKRRGPRPGSGWSEARRAAQAKRARKATSSTKSATKAPTYADTVEQVLHACSVPLMGLGRMNEAFLADALAIQMHARPLAEAVGEIATINPAVADLLDRGAPATPYLLLGSALMQMGVQIAANHGGPAVMGAHPREAMVAEMRRRMDAAAEQQAAA